jgi:tetratricopeptide (TPR) repeat protein
LEVIEEHVRHERELPCYGTLGQIMYYLGRTLRQIGDYDRAELAFSQAIDYYHQRLRFRARRGDANEPLERQFADYRTAVCLGLGLAWVDYTRGYVRRALHLLYAARALLVNHVGINTAYVELIYGLAQNALAGADERRRRAAIESMEEAYAMFAGHRHPSYAHPRYEARAAFALALAYLRVGELDRANGFAERMHTIALQCEDHRWIGYALVIKSRILRERGSVLEAEETATQATEIAAARRQVSCQIEGLIARAEARLMTKRAALAREDLIEALELTRTSSGIAADPKTEAVCCLHLVRVYVREKDYSKATRCFAEWMGLRSRVEHQSVHDLAHRVEQEMNIAGRDFVIKAGDIAALNYKILLPELKRFLLDQASSKVSGKEAIADVIGISRQALHKWQTELSK